MTCGSAERARAAKGPFAFSRQVGGAGWGTDDRGGDHNRSRRSGDRFPQGWPLDTWLRHALPVLVVVLLTGVVWSRLEVMTDSADALERSARQELRLAAAATAARLLDLPGLEDVDTDAKLAGDLLAQARPAPTPDAVSTNGAPSHLYVLVTRGGHTLALHPDGANVAPEAGSLASVRTDRVTTLSIGDTTMLATARPLTTLTSGETVRLVVMRDAASIHAGWRGQAWLGLVTLAAVAAAIFVFMAAYLRENRNRRETSSALLEMQDHFNTALQRGHCGMWDWDLEGAKITWSPSMYDMIGRPRRDESLSVGAVGDLVHAEDLDLYALASEAYAAPDRAVDRRFRLRRSDGSWMRMRLRGQIVSREGGRPRLVGIAVDVSEIEALERETARADTRLDVAVGAISEGFVLWDANRRLVRCNDRFQTFHALPDEAVRPGTRYEDVMAAALKVVHRRDLDTGAPKFEVRDYDSQRMEVQMEDGRWLQVAEHRTDDGGCVSIQTDVTRMKSDAEKLAAKIAELKASNAEQEATNTELKMTRVRLLREGQRLVEISEEHRAAQIRAETAARSKVEFLRGMSHELRTPLNAILGYSQMIQMGMVGPDVIEKHREYAKDIEDAGGFLLDVITQILDMARIDAGKRRIEPTRFDLTAALEESLGMIEVEAERKGLKIERAMPHAASIVADRGAVKQIVVNLVSNAAKFTPAGGSIHVKVRRERGLVRIAVADSGCGIAHEDIKRLGRPFQQVKNQDVRDHPGTGLGLSIARALAELHGGRLDIRSIVGRGTYVLVRLPDFENEAEALAALPAINGDAPLRDAPPVDVTIADLSDIEQRLQSGPHDISDLDEAEFERVESGLSRLSEETLDETARSILGDERAVQAQRHELRDGGEGPVGPGQRRTLH